MAVHLRMTQRKDALWDDCPFNMTVIMSLLQWYQQALLLLLSFICTQITRTVLQLFTSVDKSNYKVHRSFNKTIQYIDLMAILDENTQVYHVNGTYIKHYSKSMCKI